jgi:hypothetical protein|tara:strand:- start:901 stop:1191 length:291 start_codon:yes stop_codon:yes gene_type:complete
MTPIKGRCCTGRKLILINHKPVDRFTLVHALSGVIAAKLGLQPSTVIVIAIGWELLERPLKRKYPTFFPHPSQDTLINASLDAGAMVGAYYLARDA